MQYDILSNIENKPNERIILEYDTIKCEKDDNGNDICSADKFFKTLNDYHFFINSCNEIIKSAENNVYVFGASYNTQFLLTLGLNLNKIKGILDNCKEKQNKYLYGYNLQIFSPEVIKNKECIIILKNGYYCEEIKIQLLSINPNTIILD
jgi:hypothetical protein